MFITQEQLDEALGNLVQEVAEWAAQLESRLIITERALASILEPDQDDNFDYEPEPREEPTQEDLDALAEAANEVDPDAEA